MQHAAGAWEEGYRCRLFVLTYNMKRPHKYICILDQRERGKGALAYTIGDELFPWNPKLLVMI